MRTFPLLLAIAALPILAEDVPPADHAPKQEAMVVNSTTMEHIHVRDQNCWAGVGCRMPGRR